MDISVNLIDGKLNCCKENHNEPIILVDVDQGIPKSEMLLCLKCFQNKKQVSKYISVEQAQELIQEKISKLTIQQLQQQKDILKQLKEFQSKMMNIRTRVVNQIDEILRISDIWMKDIQKKNQRKLDIDNFLEDLELLQQDKQIEQDQFQKSNQSHYKKIDSIIKKLINQDDYQNCIKILQQTMLIQTVEQNVKSVQLINTIKQKELSFAIDFNHSGTIMLAGCDNDIKVWNFQQGNMIEEKQLNGHTGDIYCLVFSRRRNWFASGSCDCTIRCWKEDDKKDWVSMHPGKSHTKSIQCMILNNKEDQLISCSLDKTIKVWKVNWQVNQLIYDYTLEDRHTNDVFCISLNDSETALVSCGYDKRLILWIKEQNNRWLYKHELTMDDYGYRICFISENQIIWQQSRKGITHLFEYDQGQLSQKSDLNLYLDKENCDTDFFPTIRNNKRSVIIQKHNRYVYILKYQRNEQFIIVSEPIDLSDSWNYGNLTKDGEYLVIWNNWTKEFRVYNIQYE